MESGQLKLAESIPFARRTPFDAELLFDAANLKRAQGDIDGCRELLRQIDETSVVGRKARVLLDIRTTPSFRPCRRSYSTRPVRARREHLAQRRTRNCWPLSSPMNTGLAISKPLRRPVATTPTGAGGFSGFSGSPLPACPWRWRKSWPGLLRPMPHGLACKRQ